MTYDPELEDLLADLNVLTDVERRIKYHPELAAKIEAVIQPKDLEETIKAMADVVREYLKECEGL